MRRRQPRVKKSFYRTNWQINVSPIRLIDDQGKMVGVVSLEEARKTAKEKQLDLVEIAPRAKPPVVKLIDYAKFKYQEAKKQKEDRKKRKAIEDMKEIRLSPFIGDADFQGRMGRAKEFAQKQARLKLVVKFKGRQITKKQFGDEILDKAKEELIDLYKPEGNPKVIGKRMILVMNPIKHEKEEAENKKIDRQSI